LVVVVVLTRGVNCLDQRSNRERLQGKLADIKLRGGDTLLLEAERSFLNNHRNDSNFSVIHEIADYSVLGRYRLWRMLFVCLLALGMVIVSTFNIVDLLTAAFVVSCIYILTKCISMDCAMNAIKVCHNAESRKDEAHCFAHCHV
jgi:hypothetical protein